APVLVVDLRAVLESDGAATHVIVSSRLSGHCRQGWDYETRCYRRTAQHNTTAHLIDLGHCGLLQIERAVPRTTLCSLEGGGAASKNLFSDMHKFCLTAT